MRFREWTAERRSFNGLEGSHVLSYQYNLAGDVFAGPFFRQPTGQLCLSHQHRIADGDLPSKLQSERTQRLKLGPLFLLGKQHDLNVAVGVEIAFRRFLNHRFIDLLVIVRNQPNARRVFAVLVSE